MSKVWILVADDMSAAHVADVASKSGAPYEALVFGDASRADAVAALGPADLCQDFGHASSRNQAAIGMASGLGSVLSKKAAMASAGTL